MKENVKVLIVMGSDSDLPVLKGALDTLSDFGVGYQAMVCSAHRTPEDAADIAQNAKKRGFKVIIAAAGLAAHLPGVMAAFTTLPVIGLPVSGGALNGVDALYSIVQMPKGIPVATVAVNGAQNAALLAVQILALSDDDLAEKMQKHKENMKNEVKNKNMSLQKKLKELQ